eukprot:gnl/TRDRNA2_/TRDRNA2_135081_c0_seq2.p1 gnl/TRDRNA2_/TRDRNA2_135081_c0~~gnl/TRDRNA2_/TRDRNA2_135081_c0_seq2.p1  ORF type:complete len:863 (+),score=150.51 gnl/TRDRNA2_/TRDRNA2_135081_c0_seq2:385-2589(+)
MQEAVLSDCQSEVAMLERMSRLRAEVVAVRSDVACLGIAVSESNELIARSATEARQYADELAAEHREQIACLTSDLEWRKSKDKGFVSDFVQRVAEALAEERNARIRQINDLNQSRSNGQIDDSERLCALVDAMRDDSASLDAAVALSMPDSAVGTDSKERRCADYSLSKTPMGSVPVVDMARDDSINASRLSPASGPCWEMQSSRFGNVSSPQGANAAVEALLTALKAERAERTEQIAEVRRLLSQRPREKMIELSGPVSPCHRDETCQKSLLEVVEAMRCDVARLDEAADEGRNLIAKSAAEVRQHTEELVAATREQISRLASDLRAGKLGCHWDRIPRLQHSCSSDGTVTEQVVEEKVARDGLQSPSLVMKTADMSAAPDEVDALRALIEVTWSDMTRLDNALAEDRAAVTESVAEVRRYAKDIATESYRQVSCLVGTLEKQVSALLAREMELQTPEERLNRLEGDVERHAAHNTAALESERQVRSREVADLCRCVEATRGDLQRLEATMPRRHTCQTGDHPCKTGETADVVELLHRAENFAAATGEELAQVHRLLEEHIEKMGSTLRKELADGLAEERGSRAFAIAELRRAAKEASTKPTRSKSPLASEVWSRQLFSAASETLSCSTPTSATDTAGHLVESPSDALKRSDLAHTVGKTDLHLEAIRAQVGALSARWAANAATAAGRLADPPLVPTTPSANTMTETEGCVRLHSKGHSRTPSVTDELMDSS